MQTPLLIPQLDAYRVINLEKSQEAARSILFTIRASREKLDAEERLINLQVQNLQRDQRAILTKCGLEGLPVTKVYPEDEGDYKAGTVLDPEGKPYMKEVPDVVIEPPTP